MYIQKYTQKNFLVHKETGEILSFLMAVSKICTLHKSPFMMPQLIHPAAAQPGQPGHGTPPPNN